MPEVYPIDEERMLPFLTVLSKKWRFKRAGTWSMSGVTGCTTVRIVVIVHIMAHYDRV